ncbi:MAG: response regulator [Desulfobaccales bacterium]
MIKAPSSPGKVDNIKDVLMTIQNEKVKVLAMDVPLPEPMGYEAISIIKGLDRKLPIIITADENNPQQEIQVRQKGIFYTRLTRSAWMNSF